MIKAWLDKNERRALHTESLQAASQRAHAATTAKAARMRADAARLSAEADAKVARMRADAARLSAEADRLSEEAQKALQDGTSYATQFPPLPPSPRLIECGAYLYEAAMRGLVPTFHDAARRGYMVHAAALHSALQDAIALGELCQDTEGRVALDGAEGAVCELWDIRNGRQKSK